LTVGDAAEAAHVGKIARLLAVKVAAQERMRFALGAVRFSSAPDGWLRMDATNGRILVRVEALGVILPTPGRLAGSLLVARDTLKRLRSGDGLYVTEGGELAQTDPRGETIRTLRTDEDGTFPNVDDVIPAQTFSTDRFRWDKFALSPALLGDVLAVAESLASGRTDPPPVRFSYSAPPLGSDGRPVGAPLRLDAQTPYFRFIGIIMPVELG